MGVQVRLVVYHQQEEHVREVARKAFREAKRLDELLSDYKADSELSQLGNLAYPSAVEVSPELFRLLKISKEFYKASNGYFDVSSGELFKLWRAAKGTGKEPDQNAVAKAKSHAGMDSVLLDEESSMVLLKKPNMHFDLGGIAKGFASEKLLEIFRQNQITTALIDFGGSLAIGDAPASNGWTIKINDRNRSLENIYVSSSGSRFQYLEIDGRIYSHIIDPVKGIGIEYQKTITVIDTSGVRADAIATSLSVLPEKFKKAFLATMPVKEVIVHDS